MTKSQIKLALAKLGVNTHGNKVKMSDLKKVVKAAEGPDQKELDEFYSQYVETALWSSIAYGHKDEDSEKEEENPESFQFYQKEI